MPTCWTTSRRCSFLSDVGVETTVKIIRRIEERVARDKYMNASELQSILREEITALMEDAHGSSEHFGLDEGWGQYPTW